MQSKCRLKIFLQVLFWYRFQQQEECRLKLECVWNFSHRLYPQAGYHLISFVRCACLAQTSTCKNIFNRHFDCITVLDYRGVQEFMVQLALLFSNFFDFLLSVARLACSSFIRYRQNRTSLSTMHVVSKAADVVSSAIS
jgi:hypothetical protein